MTAISVERATASGQVAGLDTPADLLSLTFPSAADVGLVASLYDRQPAWDGAEDVRSYRVQISPGVVGLRVSDPARAERRKDNPDLGGFDAWAARRAASRGPRSRGLLDGPSVAETAGTRLGGLLPFLSVEDPGPLQGRSRHGRFIVDWSSKSRRNMVRTLAETDWEPFFAAGRPAMITLTYAGEWLSVAPNGRAVKAHMKALRKRWERRYGAAPVGCWKLEFQRRGAPHVHLFLALPPAVPWPVFCRWLSRAWSEVVDYADPVTRAKHFIAGTGVDIAGEPARMRDPKRLAVYFAGHSLKHKDGKEYQHVVPDAWRGPGDGPGRFWGVWGLERARVEREMTYDDFVNAKRVLRRLSRAAGRSRSVTVQRVDVTTGVLRRRSVTRRTHALGHAGIAGGWVATNHGTSLAADLARALAVMRS